MNKYSYLNLFISTTDKFSARIVLRVVSAKPREFEFFFSLSNFCSQFENFCIFKYLTNNCAQNGIRIAIPHQKKICT